MLDQFNIRIMSFKAHKRRAMSLFSFEQVPFHMKHCFPTFTLLLFESLEPSLIVGLFFFAYWSLHFDVFSLNMPFFRSCLCPNNGSTRYINSRIQIFLCLPKPLHQTRTNLTQAAHWISTSMQWIMKGKISDFLRLCMHMQMVENVRAQMQKCSLVFFLPL